MLSMAGQEDGASGSLVVSGSLLHSWCVKKMKRLDRESSVTGFLQPDALLKN